ncbi:MAG: site-specific integrase [Bacteroidales bacterium]|nr:site-specific integrase [Salinivirgaceae bacterium]MBR4214027.1 site-specific integrase [Bacteroidales bacterium]
MAKKTAFRKVKEPVKLRQKKLRNGGVSLYLDYYKQGHREYEFLGMYLNPETDSAIKEQNKAILESANFIRNQRIAEIIKNDAGLKNTQQSKMLLSDWLECYKELKENRSRSLLDQIGITQKLLKLYKGDKITLAEVDKKFCEGFLHYVQYKYVSDLTKRRLNPHTAFNYYVILNGALNYAVRRELIIKNPTAAIEQDLKPRKPESKREFLTIDEVQRLIDTDCPNPTVKQMFLFSCCCGLRFSDVARLKWENLSMVNNQLQADIRQKKTDEPIYLPLSTVAQEWLPERNGQPDGAFVFKRIVNAWVDNNIKRWAAAAGITKHVTYHVSRHTFATIQLTLGTDLYVLSKLMGHKSVTTTQIYAKVVDERKADAVNRMNNVFKL